MHHMSVYEQERIRLQLLLATTLSSRVPMSKDTESTWVFDNNIEIVGHSTLRTFLQLELILFKPMTFLIG